MNSNNDQAGVFCGCIVVAVAFFGLLIMAGVMIGIWRWALG